MGTEIELLQKLGFTYYESQICIALLHNEKSKVRELYMQTHVPKNKIYEILDQLVQKGIVKSLPTNPKEYLIEDVSVFHSIVQKKDEELKELGKNLSYLKNISRNSSRRHEIVMMNYGHNAFLEKLKDSLKSIRKENLIVAHKLTADPVILRLTEEAVNRGAAVKMLIPKGNHSSLDEWKKAGVKIRFLITDPNIVFSTFDGLSCRMNLDIATSSTDDPTLWIDDPSFVTILRDKFSVLWKAAKS